MGPDLDNNLIELNGNFNSIQNRQIIFGVKRCDPYENDDCASEEEIDDFVESIVIYGAFVEP